MMVETIQTNRKSDKGELDVYVNQGIDYLKNKETELLKERRNRQHLEAQIMAERKKHLEVAKGKKLVQRN